MARQEFGGSGGLTRLLTGEVLADNGDGTFIVDIDGDGVGVSIVRAPVVRIGEIGTVLDLDGAQVLIGPRIGDDQPTDMLSGIGSFESWGIDASTTSGLAPNGWNAFWGTASPRPVASDATWQSDGALSCAISVAATAATNQGMIQTNAAVAPAAGQNLRVTGTYRPLAAQAGNQVGVYVYWGTTAAEAQPFGGGKVSTIILTTLGSGTSEVNFDVTAPAPVGAYVYARVFFSLYGKSAPAYVAGTVRFDGIRAEWLDSGGVDTPWLPWTPVLIGSTTNPNIGTGGSGAAAVGRYTRNGTSVSGWFQIEAGTSGVSVGSGSYGVTLPIAPEASSLGTFPIQVRTGTNQFRNGMGVQFAGAQQLDRLYVTDNAGGYDTSVTNTVCQVNNSGLWRVRGTFTYEAALPVPA